MLTSKLKFWPIHMKIEFIRYNTNTGYIPWWNHFEIEALYGPFSCAPIYEFKHTSGHNQDQTGKKKMIGWIIINQCRFLTDKEKTTARNVVRSCKSIRTTDIYFQLVNAWKNMNIDNSPFSITTNQDIINRYVFFLYNKKVFNY